MFQRGYGVPQVTGKHQKHAESTYLDEYLWFKKNLAEKFLLENFLEHFERTQSKMHGFFSSCYICVTELILGLICGWSLTF